MDLQEIRWGGRREEGGGWALDWSGSGQRQVASCCKHGN